MRGSECWHRKVVRSLHDGGLGSGMGVDESREDGVDRSDVDDHRSRGDDLRSWEVLLEKIPRNKSVIEREGWLVPIEVQLRHFKWLNDLLRLVVDHRSDHWLILGLRSRLDSGRSRDCFWLSNRLSTSLRNGDSSGLDCHNFFRDFIDHSSFCV